MKKMAVFFLLSICSLFCSCVENSGRGNLKIILDNTLTVKSLRPDDRASTVVKYNVKGIGPGGKTFSRDSSGKTLTVEGLVMGTWTVSATGYNSESAAVTSGSKTFVFNNKNSSVSVPMSPSSGSGSLQVEFRWDREINNPTLEIKIEGKDFYYSENITPQDRTGSFKYAKTGLASGSYTLSVHLYNGGSHITGSVESVLICNGKPTTGTVYLTSNGENGNSSSLNIDGENTGFSGHISVEGFKSLPDTLEANREHNIRLTPDSNLPDYVSYSVAWFLDGSPYSGSEPLGKDNSICVVPTTGNHIVNAVVTNISSGESYSTSYNFSSKISAKKGSAVLINKTTAEDRLLALAPDSMIGALPDDNFIVITPSRSTMQVFSVFNNTVILTANQSYYATDLRFTWLPDAKGLYTDSRMNFFCVRTGQDCLHILAFSPTTGKIDVARLSDEPVVFSGFCSNPPCFINNVTSVAMVPSTSNGGTICVFDSGPNSREVLSITTSASAITDMGTFFKDSDMKNHLSSDGFGKTLGVITGHQTLKFCKLENGVINGNWGTMQDSELSNIRQFKFLNSNYAVLGSSNDFRIYEYYANQKLWLHRSTEKIKNNCVDVSQDGAYIYVSGPSENLTSFRSGLADNFERICTQNIDESLTALAVNITHIAGIGSSGNIYIFEIAQEDSAL